MVEMQRLQTCRPGVVSPTVEFIFTASLIKGVQNCWLGLEDFSLSQNTGIINTKQSCLGLFSPSNHQVLLYCFIT